jgi:hypothetical protein
MADPVPLLGQPPMKKNIKLIITQVRLRGQCSQLQGLPAAHENGQKNNSATPGKRDRHNQQRVIHPHPDKSPTPGEVSRG